MITRRTFLGAAAGTGAIAFVPACNAPIPDPGTERVSANGWRIDPKAIATYRIEGSRVTVDLRKDEAAAVLLHIARRWHYEVARLDTGEGGGFTGHNAEWTGGADFESNYLSGTALALHPAAYPLGGSEPLWPYHEAIVRDILVDCDGAVVWGGDLRPVKASHFHLVARAGDRTLTRVAAKLDTSQHRVMRCQTAGIVAAPTTLARRQRARELPRPR